MAVTKYCDLVLEPSFRSKGIDFYKRGLNIATANLLTTTMPIFLNAASWNGFLSLFVRMVWKRTPELFDEWRKSAELIFSHLEYAHPKAALYFAPAFLMRNSDELFETLGNDELDPLVPAYHCIVNHWGSVWGGNFEVIADDSTVLAKERARLLALASPDLKPVSVGYDRRKMDYPLKVVDIIPVVSNSHRQVQFADIIGGAIASAAKARVRGSLEPGTFAYEVFSLSLSRGLVVNAVWPRDRIDPKDLGTDGEPGPAEVDLPTYTAMILKGHPATKNTSG